MRILAAMTTVTATLLQAASLHAALPAIPPEVTVTRPDATTLSLRWHAEKPGPASVEYWTGNGPRKTAAARLAARNCRADLRGLKPNTVYRFVMRPYGDQEASRPHVFATLPPKGSVETRTLPVLGVVYTPVHYSEGGPNGTLTDADLARIRRRLEDIRSFYFRATGGKLNLAWNVVALPKDVGNGAALEVCGDLSPTFERDTEAILKAQGKTIRDFGGAIFLYGWEDARDPAKAASLNHGQGFAGGTYGTDGPWKFKETPYCVINFTRAADIRWTITHEFGHALDAMADHSGYPSLPFNHPDPSGPAGVYGEHWDCNRFLLWHFPLDNWMGLDYGSRRVSKDTDGDGLADNDPDLPMDEKRFGSDPLKKDTDSDGLDDLHEYTATMGIYEGLGESMSGPKSGPSPRKADSDGDGLKDGADPYPQYAVNVKRRYATPVFDGVWQTGEWQDAGGVKMPDGTPVRFAVQWDSRYLYVGMKSAKPVDLALDLDAANDGWFAGTDNYRVVVPAAAGNPKPEVTIWDWSVFDDKAENNPYLKQTKDLVKGDDLPAVSSANGGYTLELAIPYDYRTALRLYAGKRIGVRLGARVPGERTIRGQFEPHRLFVVELVR
jgi:hypothetical protein